MKYGAQSAFHVKHMPGILLLTFVLVPRAVQRPWGETEISLLRTKRAENFQGTEINVGQLLLVYFMRPPDFEGLGVPLLTWHLCLYQGNFK